MFRGLTARRTVAVVTNTRNDGNKPVAGSETYRAGYLGLGGESWN